MINLESKCIFDGDEYLGFYFSSQCYNCSHYDSNQMSHICKAYPQGIPSEIWTGKVIHNTPYKQDNDIVYKKSV